MAVAALCIGHLHTTYNTLSVPQNNSHAKFESKQGALWAAVFWDVTQRFVTSQKTAARETMGSVKVAWNY